MQLRPLVRGFRIIKGQEMPVKNWSRCFASQQAKQQQPQQQQQQPSEGGGLMRSNRGRNDMVSPFDHPLFRAFDIPNLFRNSFFDNWPETFNQLPAMSTDVIEEDDQYCIKCDLPGVEKQNIQITLKGNVLEISGERKEEKKEKDENQTIRRRERYYGSFVRQLVLPEDTAKDMSGIKAKFENGVLYITVPKSEATSKSPFTINVE